MRPSPSPMWRQSTPAMRRLRAAITPSAFAGTREIMIEKRGRWEEWFGPALDAAGEDRWWFKTVHNRTFRLNPLLNAGEISTAQLALAPDSDSTEVVEAAWRGQAARSPGWWSPSVTPAPASGPTVTARTWSRPSPTRSGLR